MMNYTLSVDGNPVVTGDQYKVRETIEELLEQRFGFFISLQEDTYDGDFRFYLHSDNDEDLSLSTASYLDEHHGINTHDDENTEHAIRQLLKLTIEVA